jgi:hypothetical protein
LGRIKVAKFEGLGIFVEVYVYRDIDEFILQFKENLNDII